LKHNWIILILVCCLLTTYLYSLYIRHSFDIIGYSYKVGQIADRDIIAPFTFPVFKSEEAIEREREAIIAATEPVYQISDEIKYEVIQKIDIFMETLAPIDILNYGQVNQNLGRRFGFSLSEETLNELVDQNRRLQFYNHLIQSINRIMDIGIYNDNINRDSLQLVRNDSIRRYRLERLYSKEESINRIINDMPHTGLRNVLEELLPHFVAENIIIDQEEMNQILQEEYQSIDPVLTEVLENEEIIRKNRRITEMDLRKLDALASAYSEYNDANELPELLLSIIGYFLLSVLLLVCGYMYFSVFIREHFKETKHTVVYLILILIASLMAFTVSMIPAVNIMIFPFSMTVLLFSLAFTPLGGFIYSIISFFLILPFFNWNIFDSSIIFFATLLILVIMTKMKDNHDYIPLSIYIVLSFLITVSLMALFISIPKDEYVLYVVYGLISCAISITGMILISPFIERRLNLATKMILLELLDTNNPVLKKMALETPGTFHHSITVGILAESAAEAIGANPLLARVGSYYHDIGKLENPDIYIENNSNASDIHDGMELYESAANIKNHVLEGLSIAKKYKLPQQVVDIIKQHHGDSRVTYFYNKAKEQNSELDDESAYRYFGPRPQTKEAALVMIADIIESTAKVQMHQHTEESLKKIIDDTIQRLILEDQLSEAPITLKELETVKSFILPIIVGIYRKRIEYPEDKSKQ
jgi:hypothetical protein